MNSQKKVTLGVFSEVPKQVPTGSPLGLLLEIPLDILHSPHRMSP